MLEYIFASVMTITLIAGVTALNSIARSLANIAIALHEERASAD